MTFAIKPERRISSGCDPKAIALSFASSLRVFQHVAFKRKVVESVQIQALMIRKVPESSKLVKKVA